MEIYNPISNAMDDPHITYHWHYHLGFSCYTQVCKCIKIKN